MLVLREIKEKYFDLGFNEALKDDYYTVGLILGECNNINFLIRGMKTY